MLHAPAQAINRENSGGSRNFRSQAPKLQTTVFASQQLFHAPPLNFKYNLEQFPVEVEHWFFNQLRSPHAATQAGQVFQHLKHTAFAF
ncbi:hypothetical protein LSTR_LSTR012933 [Laodelphax striatellus]|uniref:Uncharacterized protein n=1 Tax=Laodelphax striatellus TaxID=195883 RepID=A0A482X8C6_LAOST|nr:hypothetical protein LSTR_LSTR012933 [Laodelphax striatellus]